MADRLGDDDPLMAGTLRDLQWQAKLNLEAAQVTPGCANDSVVGFRDGRRYGKS